MLLYTYKRIKKKIMFYLHKHISILNLFHLLRLYIIILICKWFFLLEDFGMLKIAFFKKKKRFVT